MAMLHKRDEPSYYNIVDEDGTIIATAPKSKILQMKAKLQKKLNKKLTVETA
jgi:hypothetical protein